MENNSEQNIHPEMEDVKDGEELLTVNFQEIIIDKFDEIYKRVNNMKMQELFSEPYDPPEDYDYD